MRLGTQPVDLTTQKKCANLQTCSREDTEKTTDLPQVIDKLYHIMLDMEVEPTIKIQKFEC
jgi:hypothetical protein